MSVALYYYLNASLPTRTRMEHIRREDESRYLSILNHIRPHFHERHQINPVIPNRVNRKSSYHRTQGAIYFTANLAAVESSPPGTPLS